MEATGRLQKLWVSYLRERFTILLAVALIYFSIPDASYHVDPVSLIIVFLPVLISAELLQRRYNYPLAETFLILGIPVGLIFTTIGLLQIFGNYSNPAASPTIESVALSTNIMLLTIFYGIIICVTGSMLKGRHTVRVTCPTISTSSLLLLIGTVATTIVIALELGYGLAGGFSFYPFLLCSGISALFISSRESAGGIATSLSENLADSSLATVIIGIMISIIRLYASYGLSSDYQFIEPYLFFETTNYANYCLFYGSTLYTFAFFLSLRTGKIATINFKARNWHMLEAFSFYVFMTLAAPSIFELV